MSNDQSTRKDSDQLSVASARLPEEAELAPAEEAQAQNEEMLDADTPQAETQIYVERPKYQRILAWILAIMVFVGVLLYYAWIAGILK